jgi:hypothetical protein
MPADLEARAERVKAIVAWARRPAPSSDAANDNA